MIGLILSLYFIFICACLYGISRLQKKDPNTVVDQHFNLYISVIIPFRNEEHQLDKLLTSLDQLIYEGPWELIFVDDHSDDQGVQKIQKWLESHPMASLQKLSKELQGKKDAIAYGVRVAKGNLIVTTDADTHHSAQWLKSISAAYLSQKPSMIIGPVTLEEKGGFFSQLQAMEFLSIQFVSAGMAGLQLPVLCNGANLIFDKKAFLESQAFNDNRHLASGDDVFLLRAVKKLNYPIHFLLQKDALVHSKPQPNLMSFLAQRMRWGSKLLDFADLPTLLAAIFALMIATYAIILGIAQIFQPFRSFVFYIFMGVKILLDLIAIYTMGKIYGQPFRPGIFIALSILHPVYVLISAIIVPFYRPTWKGRPLNYLE